MILPEHRWRDGKRLWTGAEEMGFDHAWTYDHVGWRDLVDGPWFDAVATLTAAATATSRIGLGTHVASPNFRHPAVFARAVMALDDISDGRFILGVGAGGVGFDAAVLGGPQLTGRERIDRFTEFVELLKAILTNRSTTSEGAYFSAVDARSAPGPVKSSGIPMVIAANFPRSIALAARLGDGWVTTGAQADKLDDWWKAVAENSQRFEDALQEQGRGADEVSRYLLLDAAPVFSLSSVDAFADALGRAEQLGFTDVVTHWPRPSGWYAGTEAVLEEVAGRYLKPA